MSRPQNRSQGLFACAWCTHRVRTSLTHTTERMSLACPMCGRPMYPLPATFVQASPSMPGAGMAATPTEVLSRA